MPLYFLGVSMVVAEVLFILYILIMVVAAIISFYDILGKPYYAHLRKIMMGPHPLPSERRKE